MRRGYAAFAVILCGGLVCGSTAVHGQAIIHSTNPTSFTINENFFAPKTFGISPKVVAQQGYATDGVNNFLFNRSSILQTNSSWKTTYSNTKPFAGMTGMTLDHLGDGELSNGYIYVAAACSASDTKCGAKHKALAVYAVGKAGLPLVRWADITSSSCDAESGVAVGPDNTLYVSSFYVNPKQLCLFDATTLKAKGVLKLSKPIPYVQGISYNAEAQQFAVAADLASKVWVNIYMVSLDGEVTGPVYVLPTNGELEGLDYTQGYIGYDLAGYIHYLFPFQVTGNNFVSGDEVVVNGVARQTTLMNSGLLQAVIKGSSLTDFGTEKVKVVNLGPPKKTSATVKLPISAVN
jgi:hypothetical protein